MKKRSLKRFLLGISALLLATQSAMAYPKPTTGALIMPANPQDGDRSFLAQVFQLKVYEDSEDKSVYYFVPPFRAQVPTQGIGGLMNYAKIDNIYRADRLASGERAVTPADFPDDPILVYKRAELKGREEDSNWYRDQAREIHEKIKSLQDKREDAELLNSQEVIKNIDRAIATRQKEYEDIITRGKPYLEKVEAQKKENETYLAKLAQEFVEEQLMAAVRALGVAGYSILPSEFPEIDLLEHEIYKGLNELKRQVGGNMAVAVYAGFTAAEYQALSLMKKKYWPNITIKLIGANDLQFSAITQFETKDEKSREAPMFKSFIGGGDYLGGMVNMDLTVEGARSFALNLAPFYFPIVISGMVTEMTSPLKGKLVCDLKDGFHMYGRADVRDGLVIFDDDLSNFINSESNHNGACDIKLEYGNTDDARLAGLRELEKKFDELHFQRGQLSAKDAHAFYNQAKQDVEGHRRNTDNDNFSAWNGLLSGASPLVGAGIYALGMGTDFHWHTSAYDTALTANIKFEKTFQTDGKTDIRRTLPTRICLFYNANKKAYDSCTEEQEKAAKDAIEATEQAIKSQPCEGITSAYECGQNRAEQEAELRAKTSQVQVKIYNEI